MVTLELGEECQPDGENELIEKVMIASLERLRSQRETSLTASTPRGQHPKSHGCLRAEFTVSDDIPTDLRHGIFRTARPYPALVRFSSGQAHDDREADLHGMGIKLLEVDGEKILESEKDAQTQDFVLADQPSFFIRDVAEYVTFSKQVTALTGASKLRKLIDFLVQGQTSPWIMPVEDPTVVWDETKSPPIPVATLRIPPQEFDTPAVREFDENLSFSPWHALTIHRPLGGINRCRRKVYDALSAERHRANQVSRQEPGPDDWPGNLLTCQRT